jgi:cell division protein FtsW
VRTVDANAPVTAWEPRLLGIVAVTLVMFGVAVVYSASSVQAMQQFGDGSWFARRQFTGAVVGFAILLVATRIDYRVWQRNAWALLGFSAVLLLILLLPFTQEIVVTRNGARRWLNLGFVTFQPSEAAKFAVIAWTAMLAAKKGNVVRQFKQGLIPIIVVIIPVAGLIFLEPDLSTASLVVMLAAIIVFTAGAKIGHFLVIGLVALPIIWQSIASAPYRLQRVASFLSPGAELVESSWQVRQSLIAIGAGQLFGVGFGQGLQKLGYLPLAYSDFVFSTIGEEWGFLGVTLTVLLYATFILVGFRIARFAPDRFGMLLATGLTALIGLTALLHIAVTLELVPTTGLPLPFVSHGRSSLLIALFATGVLINIGGASLREGRRK